MMVTWRFVEVGPPTFAAQCGPAACALRHTCMSSTARIYVWRYAATPRPDPFDGVADSFNHVSLDSLERGPCLRLLS